jgi:hypothetical protein
MSSGSTIERHAGQAVMAIMGFPHTICRKAVSHACSLLLVGLAAGLAASAAADDLPKRKAGLWQINMRVQGMPDMGPMQQCINQNTDNLMLQHARKTDCRAVDVKRSGSTISIHSVCKMQGSTATTDGIFEGSFDSSYKGKMTTRFNPPWNGMSVSTITHEAHWLGPCKPGQKPGDVIMPSIGGINLNELMKQQR